MFSGLVDDFPENAFRIEGMKGSKQEHIIKRKDKRDVSSKKGMIQDFFQVAQAQRKKTLDLVEPPGKKSAM